MVAFPFRRCVLLGIPPQMWGFRISYAVLIVSFPQKQMIRGNVMISLGHGIDFGLETK